MNFRLQRWNAHRHAASAMRPLSSAALSQSNRRSLYPSGKETSIKLPCLLLQLSADQVAGKDTLSMISDVVASGLTGIVLHEADSGVGSLYDSAITIREALRGRALLFVVDRTDIVLASDADGVLLTDTGVPTVVAKKMISQKLVGRIVSTPMSAAQAAADGCSLVLMRAPDGGVSSEEMVVAAKLAQKSGSSIPIVQHLSDQRMSYSQINSAWVKSMDGISMPLSLLSVAAGNPSNVSLGDSASLVMNRLQQNLIPTSSKEQKTMERRSMRKMLQSVDREALVADQKQILSSVLSFLESTTPDMSELKLLRDSIQQLNDLFLVVTVGEFNSGKSSVINALLGKRYLAEGILPTTNEISILKYDPSGSGRVEQQSDGLFVQLLKAPLLQELNIVDTPGTNVILDRQQRLTEEYVPRADLVLFVMSADRPFSESEVKFLDYIRQWKKKIVFVLNKVDLLSGQDEINQVKAFVADNAKRLLKIDVPNILAVSSRFALQAKMDATAALGVNSNLSSASALRIDDESLIDHPSWPLSGFSEFEGFIGNFLVSGGGEGARLKLQTPLFVADALLGAAGEALETDLEAARLELKSVKMISQQLAKFEAEMERDGMAQREALGKVLIEVADKVEAFVDKTIQLSNLSAVSAYVIGTKGEQAALVQPFEVEMSSGPLGLIRSSVSEHSRWLETNVSSQLSYYSQFIGSRLAGSSISSPGHSSPGSASAPPSSSYPLSASMNMDYVAVKTVDEFTPTAFSLILELEMKAAVVGTSGLALGGPLGGLLFASATPNALEDLLLLTIGSLASYVSILNLPLRRAEIKKKVNQILSNYVNEVQKHMKDDLDTHMKEMVRTVNALVAPFEALCSDQVAKLEASEARRLSLLTEIKALQTQAANVE